MNHTRTIVNVNDEWLTPPEIIRSLGVFDLDPCSPVTRPWPTATRHYTKEDDGLFLPWAGRVWMNPPYGDTMAAWLNKLALHGNGIAMTFNKSDIKAFHNYVYPFASSMFLFKGRVQFYDVNGQRTKNGKPGYPSVLISYGKENLEAIRSSGLRGHQIFLNYTPVIVVAVELRTWKTIVTMSFERIGSDAHLTVIYKTVEQLAPEKIKGNPHYQAKIRQTLQTYFVRVKKGYYANGNN